MLLLAGCGSGVAPGGGDGGGEGTVNMYVSDQNNAIDDFEHLNVTITQIAAHRVDDESETEASETEVSATEPSETEEIDPEDDGWVTRDVDNVTVDLTELQGKNATMVGQIDAPNGTYDKVFVHISDVNGTLTDGSSTDVKLPSSKLHLNEEFTVGNGEEIDFVFDITVVKRGQSGSYNIQPVASESGTDQEIEERPAAQEGESDDEAEETETEAASTEDTETATPAAETEASLDFYVSDERNAIADFEHLNVTIEKVGVHRADGGGENESAWVEKDVNNATVDLTELQGANASKLGTLGVQNGTYDKTFVYVSAINGTLTNGESTNVKLPSEKLQLKKEFTVGNGESIDFVFDITVFKAGNSGKYILKPVVSESGTGDQVEIEEKDDRPEEAEENETEDEADQPLELSLDGNATAGENVTVTVTQNGSAVADAVVTANGEEVGETGENGTIVVTVPADAEELELAAESGEAEGELEVAVQQSGGEQTATATATDTESAALAGSVF